MKNSLLKISARSLLFYRKDYFNQLIIISILAAIITGSLLTGYSIRESLKKSSAEKLGNTFILASTGLRFFESSLADRISSDENLRMTPLFETDGYCQNFSTGSTSLNINIYGISNDFFDFHGINGIDIPAGTAAVNSNLAEHLGISEGEDLIIKLREADPIPANAPFAPAERKDGSIVLRVSRIIRPYQSGNFSLGISQMVPQNIFINLKDLQPDRDSSFRVNRFLVANNKNVSESAIYNIIKANITPSDIGLKIRTSEVTGEPEIISDRIFIDSSIVSTITSNISGSYPIITYLANSLKRGIREAPYSFVCGLPGNESFNIKGDQIAINKWLADDIDAKPGDIITLKWYVPVRNLLEEREMDFTLTRIILSEGRFSDPSLMPEFPGISGSTSCSSWDAGIPILMDKIRDKDEVYWNRYKGTPKAFIDYNTGKKIWSNYFGSATAVRFSREINKTLILKALSGKFEPTDAGFSVRNIKVSGDEAASTGVDFSSLFLSLGFFIILSCIILLFFSVSIFFESRKEQIRIYHSLGFRESKITLLLFYESSLITIAGSLTGVLLGCGVNTVIIFALNSVWSGAVQTNIITPDINLRPLLTGFISTLIIAQVLIIFKLKSYLKRLSLNGQKGFKFHNANLNLLLLSIASLAAIMATIFTLVLYNNSIVLSFTNGILIFIVSVLLIRQYYLGRSQNHKNISKGLYNLSKRYYSFNPSQAVAPVIFIAAGIFAIIITSSNRIGLTDEMLLNHGGTGGYLLWSESAVPVRENLNSKKGRDEFGLNEAELSDLEIIQGLRLKGDDASCLNLNHVKTPPLLGIDPGDFIRRGSFSFASKIEIPEEKNVWSLLEEQPVDNTIYGIADQTVIQWGLKLKTGDTLIFNSETGRPVKIVICAGLNSSLFQGYLIIGDKNFRNFFPSISGCSVFLFDSNKLNADPLKSLLSERFAKYGLMVETTSEKLSSFFVVTNTYLNVFTILGILGLILGVAGLGFILIRNYNQRVREFALMMATGYTKSRLRMYIIADQIIILFWGIVTGTISALFSTLPSLQGSNKISLNLVFLMILSVFAAGFIVLIISVSKVGRSGLIKQLRKE